jgi:hypothetical protein
MKCIKLREITNSFIVRPESEYNFLIKICENYYVSCKKPPNIINRVAQKIFFGFEYYKIEDNISM